MKATTTTWDLSPLLNGDDDPVIPLIRKRIEDFVTAFVQKWKSRTDYLTDPAILKEALDEYEKFGRETGMGGNEDYYFYLRTNLDTSNPDLKAKTGKVTDFMIKMANQLTFFDLNVAKIPELDQPKFLDYPGLAEYRHYLERRFAESKYLLSEAEEKLLTLKAGVSRHNWNRMVTSLLSKEEREVLQEDGTMKMESFGEIKGMLSQSSAVRESAFAAVKSINTKFVEIAEAEMNSLLEDHKVNDELRGLERPDLVRHIGDDIESEVVDALVTAVQNRFDLTQRYYVLKAKLMGQKTIRSFDRNFDLGTVDKEYTYDEGLTLVHKVMQNLDPQFAEILEMYDKNGQIDVFPRKGKRSGAFCTHNLISQPTYIMLNHTGKLFDVTSIAHELGHGINNELIKAKQNALNFGTPVSTAEVASTFMEDFVFQDLVNQMSEEEQFYLLLTKIHDDLRSINYQVAGYLFEQDMHRGFREKGYLSFAEISEMYLKQQRALSGDAVEFIPGAEYAWVSWPHMRMLFYVYSYASGTLISKSLQASVKQDPKFIIKVKEFLAAGTSDSPKNIFTKLGVDITDTNFWNKGLDEISSQLDKAEKLAIKLGKV